MTQPAMMNILEPSRNRGYGRLPIPSGRDEEIAALLESSEITTLANHVTEAHFAVLRAYAERMASHAVRAESPTILRLGLTALGLAGLAGRSADAVTILPLYYHAARMIGMVPDGLFRTVGEALGGEAETVLDDYLGRSDRDKSLESMGYRVSRDEQGFRYEREW